MTLTKSMFPFRVIFLSPVLLYELLVMLMAFFPIDSVYCPLFSGSSVAPELRQSRVGLQVPFD
jgi:hypothetical protein